MLLFVCIDCGSNCPAQCATDNSAVPATNLVAYCRTGSTANELLDTSLFISSFAEGDDGELYVLDYTNGNVHQIVDAP